MRKILQGILKGQKIKSNKQQQNKQTNQPQRHSWKREQVSQPDSYMPRMLELPDQEFKATVINMLRALMNKVDNMQE